jgi:uncharacterized protein YndB with AHSA1/START domain
MAKDGTQDISVSRVFDAPPELVYRTFADPDQLCQWFGPQGFSVPCETVQIDARPGGFQRFTIIDDDDPSQRGTVDVTFTEVTENELLAGHQDVTGVPYAGATGHARLRLRLEFHDEPHGKTRLDLVQGPFAGEAAEAVAAGWDSSFSKLDALLRRSL